MKKSRLIAVLLLTTLSCSKYGAENLKGFIEYGTGIRVESSNHNNALCLEADLKSRGLKKG